MMMKKILGVLAIATLVIAATNRPASAATITFDFSNPCLGKVCPAPLTANSPFVSGGVTVFVTGYDSSNVATTTQQNPNGIGVLSGSDVAGLETDVRTGEKLKFDFSPNTQTLLSGVEFGLNDKFAGQMHFDLYVDSVLTLSNQAVPGAAFPGLLGSVTFNGGAGYSGKTFEFKGVGGTGISFEIQKLTIDGVGVGTTATTVPEPGTMLLLGTGLAGLLTSARRRFGLKK